MSWQLVVAPGWAVALALEAARGRLPPVGLHARPAEDRWHRVVPSGVFPDGF